MSERFELLDIAGDISGKLSLIYGSGPSFHEIERYADENAGPADPAPFVLRRCRRRCHRIRNRW
jgi:hypothetical protein